jgi:hypothetical protein
MAWGLVVWSSLVSESVVRSGELDWVAVDGTEGAVSWLWTWSSRSEVSAR